ncbi:hypothetical protein O6H91_19G086200 [Diphasiastrum complanatum]|uniref:Uncharacterized protein n=2 Tax=Diphasiastrum complanatum TaxID=34168 RepID=A0ACC2AXE6_DIPCM|nr:hypothetical protein O6H91_19G086200 [Diphasiastrum complanatum]KAJ7522176.1 hypothetical protein O6H91_19G086200 [Diphasiastrum complanatum]
MSLQEHKNSCDEATMPMFASSNAGDTEPFFAAAALGLGLRGGGGGGGGRDEDLDMEEEEEASPTHLNTSTCGHFLVVSTDKLSARYTGEGRHGNDVGAIQGNRPAPSRRLVYYFEISVKDRGQKGYISIGFTNENFKTSRQPGWDPNSYGYHGDDGKLYHGHGVGDTFGPTFTVGDTIGAGINYASQEFFFTKNGKIIGTTFKDVQLPLYPTFGLHSPNEKVCVNFGQSPFVFDIEALIQEERERRQRAVENVPLPLSISHSIVRAYLLHYGYQDTLAAFDDACGGTFPSILAPKDNDPQVLHENYALNERKILRRLARDGDVDSVFAKLREWYPKLLQDGHSVVGFLLHCQKFIELVKAGALEAAVFYAQQELASFFGSPPLQNLLQDCVALLAYENPAESPVGYLFKLGQREAVADAVNACVMGTNPVLLSSGQSPQSSLEKLLRQLTACQAEMRFFYGGQGEVFRLHKILQGSKDGGW